MVEQFVQIEQDRQRTPGTEHPAHRLIELGGVYHRMPFDLRGGRLHDAQHAVDDEADDLALEVDHDDARVVRVLPRFAMTELAAHVDERDDGPPQRDDPHHGRIGVRDARDRARRDDLDDALDVDRVLLAGHDEREQLELILRSGVVGLAGLERAPFARFGSEDGTIDAAVASAAFAGDASHHGSAVSQAGEFIVFQVTDVTPAEGPLEQAANDSLENEARIGIYGDFVTAVRDEARLQVNQQALQQLLETNTGL